MLIVAEIIGEDWLPLRCALGMPAEHENPRKRHKRIQRVLLRGGIRLRSRKALAHAAESLLTCGEVDEETIEAALVLLPSSDRLHALTTRARKRARTPAHQRMHVASLLAGMQSAYLISNGVLSAQAALRSPGYMQRNARMIPRLPSLHTCSGVNPYGDPASSPMANASLAALGSTAPSTRFYLKARLKPSTYGRSLARFGIYAGVAAPAFCSTSEKSSL